MTEYLLSIDQGTTSTRAIIFNQHGRIEASSQVEFKQTFPDHGWVEHDPEEILSSVIKTCTQVLKDFAYKVTAIGITNQRETTVVWDKKSGKPIYNAIVWQDRRTAAHCEQLKTQGYEKELHKKSGLILDPYFSASKIVWILDNVVGARKRAENGELLFGTIDSYLLWHLTKGVHATDVTNASRTALFNLSDLAWDDELLHLFNIPANMLPEVKPSSANYGLTGANVLPYKIPVHAILGDQQAALVGQGCFTPGDAKCTFGTGGFLMLNTGQQVVQSSHRLLTTIAYQTATKTCYAIEGSLFMAGAIVKWLKDNLGLIASVDDMNILLAGKPHLKKLLMVPAFTGLGAPYWQPETSAALFGMSRKTDKSDIMAAALQSIGYQTRDLTTAIANDGLTLNKLRVDGGLSNNDWTMQFLSSIIQVPVERPKNIESTALGAAMFAGLESGLYKDLSEIAQLNPTEHQFTPEFGAQEAEDLYKYWQKAVETVIAFA
ncbi:glycerol kinase GlpK [Gayadomonas joobiniege]|uniref:glycerol kinase GlpK n=1 Tax=Gayadomonas joobiniege TaxID=1234606 RepID=UPI000363F252|nr:glycerol kinase GlpK [Gayadomonas joobiniege]